VLGLVLAGAGEALLYLTPALLLLFPLAAGRYVGESLVLKLASRRRGRRTRPRRVRSLPKAPAIWSPRGTSLLALSLAGRPPPAAVLPLT
jgi:hypothetical protein